MNLRAARGGGRGMKDNGLSSKKLIELCEPRKYHHERKKTRRVGKKEGMEKEEMKIK
jgi:hypothetical protein